jgi:uncharacterized protein DUF1707/2TM domain-containing protein
MCHSTYWSAERWSIDRDIDERGSWPPDPHRRAGDAERDETITLLSDAAAEGYLTPDELDERTGVALTARTIGDLTDLLRDLPPEKRALRPGRAGSSRGNSEAKNAVRAEVVTYLRVMAVLLIIWLMVGIAAGAWYFWPIWPALGWGVALVTRLGLAARWGVR